jgi:hypothetical protein
MQNIDRVRENTSAELNIEFDREIARHVRGFEGRSKAEISGRIDELDREWDVERSLQTNASILALSGLALGMTVSKKWLALPAVVLPFLLQHAVQGWCPPLPVLRRLGIRTRKEIESEKYALKAMRGDFAGVGEGATAQEALRAVNAGARTRV